MTHLEELESVPAEALRPGQTIWLNPARAGVPRRVEHVDDYEGVADDVRVVLAPGFGLPRSAMRFPRGYKLEVL